MKVCLNIDGEKIPLGCHTLDYVINSMLDAPGNGKLFNRLALHPSLNVRIGIASKKNIDKQTFETLFSSGESHIISCLIGNHIGCCNLRGEHEITHITMQHYQRLCSSKDSFILSTISNMMTEYWFNSKLYADIRKLIDHPNPDVRYALADNYACPPKLLKLLTQDPDPDVRFRALYALE
ncbi:MAG: HEAT repeat domain-containing protein [Mariprofundales bacterium]|nr:HEAT repeat domain-containing protein [Mariprofundales bacterium]